MSMISDDSEASRHHLQRLGESREHEVPTCSDNFPTTSSDYVSPPSFGSMPAPNETGGSKSFVMATPHSPSESVRQQLDQSRDERISELLRQAKEGDSINLTDMPINERPEWAVAMERSKSAMTNSSAGSDIATLDEETLASLLDDRGFLRNDKRSSKDLNVKEELRKRQLQAKPSKTTVLTNSSGESKPSQTSQDSSGRLAPSSGTGTGSGSGSGNGGGSGSGSQASASVLSSNPQRTGVGEWGGWNSSELPLRGRVMMRGSSSGGAPASGSHPGRLADSARKADHRLSLGAGGSRPGDAPVTAEAIRSASDAMSAKTRLTDGSKNTNSSVETNAAKSVASDHSASTSELGSASRRQAIRNKNRYSSDTFGEHLRS
ncbi:hypothetical protein CBOM_07335 [Ceraceosorus bombacis]|uniref:Uncharacterized protein n=1 Tax=Ceraceosorus bombacis TaxID=401625 RepID=A0A0P1B7R5_9BASI|nr:hypothetical protein CBOM_07335 [Ceraceosorus bombacis]